MIKIKVKPKNRRKTRSENKKKKFKRYEKMTKQQEQQKIFCSICKNEKSSRFCSNCQRKTPNFFNIHLFDTVKAHESIGIKQKRPGFKGFLKFFFAGFKPSGDPKLSEGVDVQMVIDREKKEYHHIVKDNLTGKIIHEEHEPLDQHKSKNEKTNKK